MEKTICTVAKSFQFSLGNRGKAGGKGGSIAPVKNEAEVANGAGNEDEDAIRSCRGGRAEREAEAEAEAEAKSQRSHK